MAASDLPLLTERREEIVAKMAGRRLAVFLDYDGTLCPIVARPELATLTEEQREGLRGLAGTCPVAVVSGRALHDLRQRVGLPELYYAGSHGCEIAGPGGLSFELDPAIRGRLSEIGEQVQDRIGSWPGVIVERKPYSIALHYRLSDEPTAGKVIEFATTLVARHLGLRLSGGKKIVEIRPDKDWHKGKAALWLLEHLPGDGERLPIFIGDDLTDEDGFRSLGDRGVSVLVAETPRESAAQYRMRDPEEVHRFIAWLRGPEQGWVT